MEKLQKNKQINNESPVEQTYSDYDLEVKETEQKIDDDTFQNVEQQLKAGVNENDDINVLDKKHQSEPDSDRRQKEQQSDGEDKDTTDNKLDKEEEMVLCAFIKTHLNDKIIDMLYVSSCKEYKFIYCFDLFAGRTRSRCSHGKNKAACMQP